MTTTTPAPAAPNPGYLCFAYGETDHPVCQYVMTPEEVGQFLCAEWFGEQPETMGGEGREHYDWAMSRVRANKNDPDGWDGTDKLEFKFEIGGITITRCYQAAALASPTSAAPQVEPMEMCLCESHRLVLRLGQPYVFKEMEGCASCKEMADQAREAYRPDGGAPKEG